MANRPSAPEAERDDGRKVLQDKLKLLRGAASVRPNMALDILTGRADEERVDEARLRLAGLLAAPPAPTPAADEEDGPAAPLPTMILPRPVTGPESLVLPRAAPGPPTLVLPGPALSPEEAERLVEGVTAAWEAEAYTEAHAAVAEPPAAPAPLSVAPARAVTEPLGAAPVAPPPAAWSRSALVAEPAVGPRRPDPSVEQRPGASPAATAQLLDPVAETSPVAGVPAAPAAPAAPGWRAVGGLPIVATLLVAGAALGGMLLLRPLLDDTPRETRVVQVVLQPPPTSQPTGASATGGTSPAASAAAPASGQAQAPSASGAASAVQPGTATTSATQPAVPPTAPPADPRASRLTTLVDEQFGAGAAGWPDDPRSTAWVDGGRYTLAARHPGRFVAIAAPVAAPGRDSVLSGTFRKVGGPAGGGYGLIVRDQRQPGPLDGLRQTGRFYVFEVGDKGELGVWLRDGGAWQDVMPWTPTGAVKPGTAVNELTVQTAGDSLRFLVNGTRVTSVSATLPEGGVGVFVGGDGNQVVLERFTLRVPE